MLETKLKNGHSIILKMWLLGPTGNNVYNPNEILTFLKCLSGSLNRRRRSDEAVRRRRDFLLTSSLKQNCFSCPFFLNEGPFSSLKFFSKAAHLRPSCPWPAFSFRLHLILDPYNSCQEAAELSFRHGSSFVFGAGHD